MRVSVVLVEGGEWRVGVSYMKIAPPNLAQPEVDDRNLTLCFSEPNGTIPNRVLMIQQTLIVKID